MKPSNRKQKSQHYICRSCSEELLSQIELSAHREMHESPHQRPTTFVKASPDIVEEIEDLRERVERGYHGYRESDRSS